MADAPTKEAEAAQALFCSLADFVGVNNIRKVFTSGPTGTINGSYQQFIRKTFEYPINATGQELIDKAFERVKTPGVSKDLIFNLLKNKAGWYKSSVLTALKLSEDIDTINKKYTYLTEINWQDFYYVRGGAGGKTAMDDIDDLFKIANRNDKEFGDINKWSPADIYFISDAGKTEIKSKKKSVYSTVANKSAFGLVQLNQFVDGLVISGHLLPLSLKKVVGEEAHLFNYNFIRSKEEGELATIKYESVDSQGTKKVSAPSTYSNNLKKKKTTTRDLKIFFESDGKSGGNIKIRHTPGHAKFGVNKGIKVEIEKKGAGGRLGQFVGLPIMLKLLKNKNGKSVAPGFEKIIDSFKWKAYEDAVATLNEQYGVKSTSSRSMLTRKRYEDYREDLVNLSGLYVDDALYPAVGAWFENDLKDKKSKGKSANKVLEKWIEYASSRSPSSGMFVIAK